MKRALLIAVIVLGVLAWLVYSGLVFVAVTA